LNDGWIKLHRKLLDNKIFDNERLLKVWVWCLLKASHTEYDQLVGLQTVHLIPGQFIYGRFKNAEELKLNPNTLKDYMKFLSDEKFIAIKSTNKYSVVSVEKWELYQSERIENTSKTPAKHQQNTTNKNVKNVKNEDIYTIFEHWNSKKIITHKTMSDRLKGHINARLEKYTVEEIAEAINNYATILQGEEYFWSYKWGLGEFLSRENGFEKFLTSSNPFVNYRKKGGPPRGSNGGNQPDTETDWNNYDPIKDAGLYTPDGSPVDPDWRKKLRK